MKRNPALVLFGAFGVLIAVGVCLLAVLVGLVVMAPSDTTGAPARIASQGAEEVNVWRDYNDRSKGVVAVVREGDSVRILQREGEAVQIRTSGGDVGWVNRGFIR